MQINFFVPGKPRGKGRPRFFRGHAVTDSKTRDYESLVCHNALKAMKALRGELGEAIVNKEREHGCTVDLTAFFKVPKSYTKVKRESALNGLIHPSKPDADNIVKAVLDGMNKVVYEDDVEVFKVSCLKLYSDTLEGVEVIVRWGDSDE